MCTGSVEKLFWNIFWEVFRILLCCMCYVFYSNGYIYTRISLLLWEHFHILVENSFWSCSKRYHLCDNFTCPKWNEVSCYRTVFLLEWMCLSQDMLLGQLCQQIFLSLTIVKIANRNDDTISTNVVCYYSLVCISKIVSWIPVFIIPYQLPNSVFCTFLACWKIIRLKHWFFSSWTN